MRSALICFVHEYCTNCPQRKECTMRPLFYSDEEYTKWRIETMKRTEEVAKDLGIYTSSSPLGIEIGAQMMDKRRAKELELHKTFSIN